MADDTAPAAVAPLAVADPAPLGLGGFALTTFLLSVHNAFPMQAPGVEFLGLAFFYGGAAQFAAGMWEFKNRNTFGATAFSTYGAFWLSLAFYFMFLAPKTTTLPNDVGWFLVGFAAFNTYMLLWSMRVNAAVFLVFLTLEVTEILLFVGLFTVSTPPAPDVDAIYRIGGVVGIATAVAAWYASAAGVANSLARRPLLPVGKPMWTS